MRDIFDAKSVGDLEKIGSLDVLRSKLEEVVAPLKVNAHSYNEILEVIEVLKEKWLPLSQLIFTSKRQQIIYFLLEHDGEKRNALLGITDDMYEDQEAATKWFRRLAQIIRADINTDARSAQAFQVLQDIRSNLVDDDEFGAGNE
ncbi:hypothetical protein [Pseudomonas viridiflava]|uniref:hypothetical protein n=1 Tax=Pseudomonas viridiflava TaxID=33069 RepID=UPI002EC2F585|nr:hypothetical protein [Pseudomonas viridiflava]